MGNINFLRVTREIISTLMIALPKNRLHIHITIPRVLNVGIKILESWKRVEWTTNPDWLDYCNTMDRVIVPTL